MSRARPLQFLRLLAAAAALPLATACLDTGEPDQIEVVANSCTWDPALMGVTFGTGTTAFSFDTSKYTKTATGLYYRDIVVGGGSNVTKGNDIAVHYTGWLSVGTPTIPSGTPFDASIPPADAPFVFPAGVGAVIPGFDEGVSTMRVGGCRALIIPPVLGYGSVANGPIPANSTLVFEVSVIGQR